MVLLAFAFWYILETSLIEQRKKFYSGGAKTKFENIVFTLFMCFNGLCHDLLQHRT